MAVIFLSGKQFLVKDGEKISVSKLTRKVGEVFEVEDQLGGEKIKLKVLKTFKGPKTRVLKFKAKTGYKRIFGSRDILTELEVVGAKAKKIE